MRKTGIIIWRMNPPHIGHIFLIKKSLNENPHTFLFIATKKESKNEKDPFPASKIKEFLGLVFEKEIEEKILIIDEIEDTPSDKLWVKNIFEKIKSFVIFKSEITFYWWDISRDSAIICIKQYIDIFRVYKVNFEELNRYKNTIKIGEEEIKISWTNLRQALKEWKKEIVEKMLDEKIYKNIGLWR